MNALRNAISNEAPDGLKTYPNMGLIEQLFYGSICKIKKYQPFYNLNYSKQGWC